MMLEVSNVVFLQFLVLGSLSMAIPLYLSKLFAINIVKVAEAKLSTQNDSCVKRDDSEHRLRLLEHHVESLKEWKSSVLFDVTAFKGNLSPPSSASLSTAHEEDIQGSGTSASPIWSPKIKPVRDKRVRTRPEPLQLADFKEAEPDVTTRIMEIIQSYGQNEKNSSGDAWLGRSKFEPMIRKAVDTNEPILLVLPAFPWKSVNKVEKVLGALPDLGEVLGLGRLNQLCEDIEEIHEPGARVTITSDGLVYNDLLGISDEEVYEYGAALRRIPPEQGYKNIEFIRIMNLMGLTDHEVSKAEYFETAGRVRETLVERFLDPAFVATDAIEEDMDIKLTYCGYVKFLAKDLEHSPVTAGITSKSEYRRAVKKVAHDMIVRGRAFAAAIEWAMPNHVRLSIHRSPGVKRKENFAPRIDLVSTFFNPGTRPGASLTHRALQKSALQGTHDIIERNGRPFCFRDRSDVWDWPDGVEFDFRYPKTLIVKAKVAQGRDAPRLGEKEMRKLDALGKGFSPVIICGFSM